MRDKLALLLQQTLESYMNVNPHRGDKAPGWEVWFAHWLLHISDIREVLGVEPTPATLEKILLKVDNLYNRVPTAKTWSQFMADEIINIVQRYTRQKQ